MVRTLGSEDLVSALGPPSYMIMSESLTRSKLLHTGNVGDHCISLMGIW